MIQEEEEDQQTQTDDEDFHYTIRVPKRIPYPGLTKRGATTSLNCLIFSLYLIKKIRYTIFNTEATSEESNSFVQLQKLFTLMEFHNEVLHTTKYLTKSFHWSKGDYSEEHPIEEFNQYLFPDELLVQNSQLESLLTVLFKPPTEDQPDLSFSIPITNSLNPFDPPTSDASDVVEIKTEEPDVDQKYRIYNSPDILRFQYHSNDDQETFTGSFPSSFNTSEYFKVNNKGDDYTLIGIISIIDDDNYVLYFSIKKQWHLFDSNIIKKIHKKEINLQRIVLLIYAKTLKLKKLFEDGTIPNKFINYNNKYIYYIDKQIQNNEYFQFSFITLDSINHEAQYGNINFDENKIKLNVKMNGNVHNIYEVASHYYKVDTNEINLYIYDTINNKIISKVPDSLDTKNIVQFVDKTFLIVLNDNILDEINENNFLVFIFSYNNESYPPLELKYLVPIRKNDIFRNLLNEYFNINYKFYIIKQNKFIEIKNLKLKITEIVNSGGLIFAEKVKSDGPDKEFQQINNMTPKSFLPPKFENTYDMLDNYPYRFPKSINEYFHLKKNSLNVNVTYEQRTLHFTFPETTTYIEFKKFVFSEFCYFNLCMFRDSIIFYKKNSTEQLEADDNMIMKDLLNNEIKDLKLRIFQSLNESCLINTTTLLIQIRDEKKLKYTVPDDFTIENVLEVAKNRKWFGKEEDLRVLELNEEFKPVKEVELEEPVADIDYPIRIEPIEY